MNDKYIPLEKLLDEADGSIYKLVILAAKRAFYLAGGEKPLIDNPSEKAIDNALREIMEGKIRVKSSK
ncbi:MAG: DNA-directed RNA polymerase subunit omega [Candidatus Omnitrophica bacterium]|nr:DNA-directed RNA polymerase subunit omega [Candidatus Omnitrophota bacterium]MCM8831285.1 DNA-directed RNA polymerase subunit omega [Candidatus Omnitrophota bacterium]